MKTILLIEDDTVLANMYSQKLTIEGYKVLIAREGEQALNMAKEDMPDLVITDIMLPKMSGIDFLTQFKKINKKAKVPIIAWSNLTDDSEKEKALKLGAKEYLIKANLSLEEIMATVKKYIG